MVLGTIMMAAASLTASLFVVQVAVLPLVFKYSKYVQRKIVFSNCINYPKNLDYENPSKYLVVGGRNLYIEFKSVVDDCDIKIGIWHLIPKSRFHQIFVRKDCNIEDSSAFDLRNTKQPVVIYFHGNSNHRASPQRLEAYKVFQSLNFHVITFDYRGYGDSTAVRPTESGVVEDALKVYEWLHGNIGGDGASPPVVLWGHSLGTAVAANLVANLRSLCSHHLHQDCLPFPAALILEAPFNNLVEEISSHPMSKLVSWLPYYACTFLRPFAISSEYEFATDSHLTTVPDVPILMLHAMDDKIVPYELAVKLFKTLEGSRTKGGAALKLHTFEKGCGLGHNNICSAPDIQAVVESFIESIRNKKENEILEEETEMKTEQVENENHENYEKIENEAQTIPIIDFTNCEIVAEC